MKNKKFLNETLLVFLLAMLTFSVPLMTEAKVEENAAKRDAEKDAARVNELRWFAAGFFGGAAPFLSLWVLPFDEGNYDVTYACWLSLLGTGVLLPTGYAVFDSPSPPADRFLGKSSDYVDAYTTAYRRQVKRQRIKLSATGCIIGTFLGCVLAQFAPINNGGMGLE